MNKHKKNLDLLRQYLGRDVKALELLDAINRDLTDQRKEIRRLEDVVRRSSEESTNCRKALADVQAEKETISRALETERQRIKSVKINEARLYCRIAELERETKVADEAGPGDVHEAIGQKCLTSGELSECANMPSPSVDWRVNKIRELSKMVRKRYRKIPLPFGTTRTLRLEDVVKSYSHDEFTGVGMLVCLMALAGVPAMVEAETTMTRLSGWDEKFGAQFFYWYAPWIKHGKIESRLVEVAYGGADAGVVGVSGLLERRKPIRRAVPEDPS